MNLKLRWQRYHGHLNAAQAQRLVATHTIEMSMKVIEMLPLLTTMARRGTHCILYRATAIIDGM